MAKKKEKVEPKYMFACTGTWEKVMEERPKDKKYWCFEDHNVNSEFVLLWDGKKVRKEKYEDCMKR